MEKYQKNFIETYQCRGCVCGSSIECFEKGDGIECGKHVAGTTISHIGKVFLGLPIGFDRLGPVENMKIYGFQAFQDGWRYDKFNIPVWKYKDKHGNTLVRGISPRTNFPFIHIFLGDCMSKIDCLEITNKDINEMD